MEPIAERKNKFHRIVYGSGAPVRSGLELSSSIVEIIPKGFIIKVSEEAFNSQGTRRLRIADGRGWTSAQDIDGRNVALFISHKLFTVVYSSGALVRSGLELSSPAVTTLPKGSHIEISEEVVNSNGIQRLKLADGRGWTSLRDTEGTEVVIEIPLDGTTFCCFGDPVVTQKPNLISDPTSVFTSATSGLLFPAVPASNTTSLSPNPQGSWKHELCDCFRYTIYLLVFFCPC